MDWGKLIEIAAKLPGGDLAARGAQLASDAAQFAALVRANAERARDVLTKGDRATLDRIHAEALAAADALDAKLAKAASGAAE